MATETPITVAQLRKLLKDTTKPIASSVELFGVDLSEKLYWHHATQSYAPSEYHWAFTCRVAKIDRETVVVFYAHDSNGRRLSAGAGEGFRSDGTKTLQLRFIHTATINGHKFRVKR